jgi:MFS transporter, ACS family, DAL5 transporter family protein
MSTDIQRSSIEKQGSTDTQLEKRDTDSGDNVLDFGGDSTLPPPPKLTPEEEHKLYRKLDLR